MRGLRRDFSSNLPIQCNQVPPSFFLFKSVRLGYHPPMETGIIVKLVVIGAVILAAALYLYLYR
jgi:hypothetical protein